MNALAEGEELGSNTLSQDFAAVRSTAALRPRQLRSEGLSHFALLVGLLFSGLGFKFIVDRAKAFALPRRKWASNSFRPRP